MWIANTINICLPPQRFYFLITLSFSLNSTSQQSSLNKTLNTRNLLIFHYIFPFLSVILALTVFLTSYFYWSFRKTHVFNFFSLSFHPPASFPFSILPFFFSCVYYPSSSYTSFLSPPSRPFFSSGRCSSSLRVDAFQWGSLLFLIHAPCRSPSLTLPIYACSCCLRCSFFFHCWGRFIASFVRVQTWFASCNHLLSWFFYIFFF